MTRQPSPEPELDSLEELRHRIYEISLTPIVQINDGIKNSPGSWGLSNNKIDQIIELIQAQSYIEGQKAKHKELNDKYNAEVEKRVNQAFDEGYDTALEHQGAVWEGQKPEEAYLYKKGFNAAISRALELSLLEKFVTDFDRHDWQKASQSIKAYDKAKAQILAKFREVEREALHLHQYDDETNQCIYCGLTLADLMELTEEQLKAKGESNPQTGEDE